MGSCESSVEPALGSVVSLHRFPTEIYRKFAYHIRPSSRPDFASLELGLRKNVQSTQLDVLAKLGFGIILNHTCQSIGPNTLPDMP